MSARKPLVLILCDSFSVVPALGNVLEVELSVHKLGVVAHYKHTYKARHQKAWAI